MIDFNKLQKERIKSFHGGNGYIDLEKFDNGLNTILRGKLAPGASVGMHTHDTSSETIFIVAGKAKFVIDGKEETLFAGQCHYCKKGQSHTLINNGFTDLIFHAVIAEQ